MLASCFFSGLPFAGRQISTKALFVLTAGVAVVLGMFSILENGSIPEELSIPIVIGVSLVGFRGGPRLRC